MQRLAVLAFLVLVAAVAAGCGMLAGRGPEPTPQPCDHLYDVRRCLAIVDAATAYSDATRDDVEAILIVPSPRPSDGILVTLGGAPRVTIRLVMRDGTTTDTQICGGVDMSPACADEPQAWDTQGDLIGSGYHDVPAGSTPVPTIDPDVAGAGIPIEVASRTIPIDRAGPFEVSLGRGALPNGVLSAASYRIVDPWATSVTYRPEGEPRLEIRSLEPDGRPFANAYDHGWRDGVERVEAVLVFDVKRFDPGATVKVADVVVR